ncbi:MAG: T9SS type A sorting domain-containing protein [Bacteroidia bacterium]|nr:T9SS type A sorting domain-containing protein [Bacteroidia bacterium]
MIKYYYLNLKLCLLFLALACQINPASSQSNPVALKPAIQIDRVMTVQNGIVRLVQDPVSKKLWYSDTNGNVYVVIQPQVGAAYDSLVYSTAQHGVQYVQGMAAHDSTLYVSGNNNSNTALTTGLITRGKLQANGTRTWDTLMITDPYETADYFDHLFSGMTVSPAGDSVFICSGARGDHGEIQDRYGAYPNLRNVPLTTNLYGMPTNGSSAILLENDSLWHTTTQYLYARGIRNTFSMAFDGSGNLFGVENSGDRDHNEEMNWMRRGRHYGFPWKMGDSNNPQQFPGYNPAADSLIPHFSRSWRQGFWDNDPAFPAPPLGLTFEEPIQNIGPDADKFRDSLTDGVRDASDLGMSIGTFTAHRSPLGLVFDRTNILHPAYQGDGFMLSWTEGLDSCGCSSVPDTSIGPFVDPSEDLLHLDLVYNSTLDNFQLSATRIVGDFEHPIDAVIDSNVIFVIENGYGGTSGLYKITMPGIQVCPAQVDVEYIDTCFTGPASAIATPGGTPPYSVDWYDVNGNNIRNNPATNTADTLNPATAGDYYVIVEDSTACRDTVYFTVQAPLQLTIDTATGTTCIGCTDGSIDFTAIGGTPPYTYLSTPASGTFAGLSLINLPADTFIICVIDAIGCISCDTAIVLDDPTSIGKISDLNSTVFVFPNPASKSVNIRLAAKNPEQSEIRITDIEGRVQSTQIISRKQTGTGLDVSVNIEHLVQGTYIVEVNLDGTLHRVMLNVFN